MQGGSSSSSVSKKVVDSTLERNKSCVWLLLSREDGGYFTGFGVHGSRLVMSCGHGFVHLTVKEFIGRRIDQEEFYGATLVHCDETYDLSLFCIESTKKYEFRVAKLATDGSLDEGCPVFTVGNSAEFCSSFSPGFVSYACVEEVDLPLSDEKCFDYQLESLVQSPSHRVFGHIWHSTYFRRTSKVIEKMKNSLEKEKLQRLFLSHSNLNPRVPIVQCTGLTICPGGSGGPLFNQNGEVVGCVVSQPLGFEIAVHVTLLRHFLASYLDRQSRS